MQYTHFNFALAVLEDLGPTGTISKSELLDREQYYLNILFGKAPVSIPSRPLRTCKSANVLSDSKSLNPDAEKVASAILRKASAAAKPRVSCDKKSGEGYENIQPNNRCCCREDIIKYNIILNQAPIAGSTLGLKHTLL